MSWKLFEGDCLEVMPLEIEDKSIDMILCDLPYGTTACKWDSIIPLEPLWKEYKRIIKDNGAIVLTASQPFTTKLISSNYDMFKYCWVWNKSNPSNIALANKQPLKYHEDICVFYKNQPNYNKQMIKRESPRIKQMHDADYKIHNSQSEQTGLKYIEVDSKKYNAEYKNPSSVLFFNSLRPNAKEFVKHPTQKPVKLFEYLIKTYTNEGDLILDNCAGSGTTGVAAEITNRNSILIEKEPEYCEIIKKRLSEINLEQYQPQRTHKPLTAF